VIVRSSYQIVGLRVVRRFWDDDLLVEATVLSDVVRATYEPRSGTWRSLVTTTTATQFRPGCATLSASGAS